MKISLPVALILFLVFASGCRKSTEPVIWSKNLGTGNALFIKATSDSGLAACGELGGNPFLIKLDRNKNKIQGYTYQADGVFSSLWMNNVYCIAGGSSKGKMLLTCVDSFNNLLWDTLITSSSEVDRTLLCYLGNGKFAAIGSSAPDTLTSIVTGLTCVWFESDGTITGIKEIRESSSVYANQVILDNTGNFYIALSRKYTGQASRATVAKYDRDFSTLWETELYNNPVFSSSCTCIAIDNSGFLYLSGNTELSDVSGTSSNTFSVKLANSGAIIWKKYLESSNSGSSVLIDNSGQLLILNRNCFRINVLNVSDGSSSGVIRTFNACDANKTDALSTCFDINYDGNLIISGSKGGGFYLVMKSPLLQETNP
jgi:hypothetical protein